MSENKRTEYLKVILEKAKAKAFAYVKPTITAIAITGTVHSLGLSVGG